MYRTRANPLCRNCAYDCFARSNNCCELKCSSRCGRSSWSQRRQESWRAMRNHCALRCDWQDASEAWTRQNIKRRKVRQCWSEKKDRLPTHNFLQLDFVFLDGGTKRKKPTRKGCDLHHGTIIKTPQHYCQGLSIVPVPDNKNVRNELMWVFAMETGNQLIPGSAADDKFGPRSTTSYPLPA